MPTPFDYSRSSTPFSQRYTPGAGIGGVGGGLTVPGGAGTPVAPTLAGMDPRAYDPAYGGIPTVPNPAASQTSAIGSNLSNLQRLYNLTTGLDTASGAGAMKALETEIPGVTGSIGSAKGQIDTMISGQLPKDVIDQLAQQSAEIGAGRGMGPMAGATNAGYLRALGLTSLGETQAGLGALNSLMGSVPRAPLFDPSSMLLNPNDVQGWNYLANTLRAAPEPAAAAKANIAALREGIGEGNISRPGPYTISAGGGPHPGTDSLGFPIDPAYAGGGGYPNLPVLGAINPQQSVSTSFAGLPPGMTYGAKGGWSYDPTVGAYVNAATGQIADTPGGTPWEGFSQAGVGAPATDEMAMTPGGYSEDDYF